MIWIGAEETGGAEYVAADVGSNGLRVIKPLQIGWHATQNSPDGHPFGGRVAGEEIGQSFIKPNRDYYNIH
jgi:hypothetical protein